MPEVDNGIAASPVKLIDGSSFEGAVRANPRKGGDLWAGEEQATRIVQRTPRTQAARVTGSASRLLVMR